MVRIRLRYRLRTLFFIGVIACLLFTFVRPYVAQKRTMALFMKRNVYIATQSKLPMWAGSRTKLAHLIADPVQAQVLFSWVSPEKIEILGKVHSMESAEPELIELKKELHDELKLSGFILVETRPAPAGVNLLQFLRWCKRLGTVVTPCGTGNFPPLGNLEFERKCRARLEPLAKALSKAGTIAVDHLRSRLCAFA